MTTPDHYLVLDLEATCDEHHAIPRDQTEIIEIGAVLVRAATLETAAEFQTFVRPVRHPRLTAFCTQLTTITQADVDGAPSLREALAALARFVEGRDFLFCSWGDYDRDQLARDARRNGLRVPLGERHWNLKRAFGELAGGARPFGTGMAMRRAGLPRTGVSHRGIDDARNIARLLPFLLGRSPLPRQAR